MWNLFTNEKDSLIRNGKIDIQIYCTGGYEMAFLFAWLLLLVVGGIGGIAICSVLYGNEVFTGYAAMLGMIVALLSGIFFQLNLMHRDKE